MMRFLMIHTAGAEGSVALGDAGAAQTIVATEMLPGRTSSERLVPAVRRLMRASGWKLSELTAVVVVHGPGSFTGVRVGVSAAKGLSEAGGVPLIAVSRLALLAGSVDDGGEKVHTVLDAGRGEFYYGEYVGRSCVREALMCAQDVMVAASGGLVVVCEAKVEESLVELRLRLVEEPLAGDALPFAVERVVSGEFDDAATLDANYLRRTDAEIFAKPAVPRSAR
ncbi:tRNA (adenosine(37)-N6)-threonylcarbamoyltransferase complex dimerization subunit type 1 TsaB [Tunturibacter psychrotolerans]|uniref:tRNA (Adenosine(37)-N6)-threonylcarbamoyltransferase complex dimerization subunit type 1 TsaB n=1 Tax=Tunturiibacter psychrotolerans TaxID=3069686 RepID=A0AAU7ZNT6_9BACT